MSDEDFLADLDRQSEQQTQRVREMLYQYGRPDLVADLDAKLQDIRTGVATAQGTWHALSKPQRRVLAQMAEGWHLKRSATDLNSTMFHGHGGPGGFVLGNLAREATVRNLMARELVAWADGKKVVLTERGRFVLKHGPL